MDFDLMLDIFSFCREKYFVHQAIARQTRISFVDYVRVFYLRNLDSQWVRKKDCIVHQEYGPAEERPNLYVWRCNGQVGRRNGASLVYEIPETPRLAYIQGGHCGYAVKYKGRTILVVNIPRDFSPDVIGVKKLWADAYGNVSKASLIIGGEEMVFGQK